MVRLVPFFVLSEHRVQDGQQFAHTGNQRHFFGVFRCKQTCVKHLHHRDKAGRHQCGHVQRRSYTRASTKNGSPATHRSRVPVYQRNTHKHADFPAREFTLGKESRDSTCSISHAYFNEVYFQK